MTTKKMATLVIHAPDYKVKQGGMSFKAVLAGGIGPGYAIYKSCISQLTIPGSKVVVLRNNKIGPPHKRERAEGKLVKLQSTGVFAKNGVQRNDVYFGDWKKVDYAPENLNHCGVAVIDC
ncbi:MAG: hypothetical protein KAV87_67140 [Desulfobacteraceae bacterium]|nr:hypothetical protein [Desulfobacteraceae bacterium]